MGDALALTQRLVGGASRIRWSAKDIERIAERYHVAGTHAASIWRDVAPPAPVLPALKASAGTSASVFTATCTEEVVDRLGDIVFADGVGIANFMKSGTILSQHDGSLPIGRPTRVWRDGNKTRMTATLATEASPVAAQVAALIDARVLRAVSIGFAPVTWKWATDPARKGAIDFLAIDLIEVSVVSCPALPSATIRYRSGAQSRLAGPATGLPGSHGGSGRSPRSRRPQASAPPAHASGHARSRSFDCAVAQRQMLGLVVLVLFALARLTNP